MRHDQQPTATVRWSGGSSPTVVSRQGWCSTISAHTEDPSTALATAILTYGDPENVADALIELIEKAADIVEDAMSGGSR
jgi:hypothetical protein